jgi:hypothetical protein
MDGEVERTVKEVIIAQGTLFVVSELSYHASPCDVVDTEIKLNQTKPNHWH